MAILLPSGSGKTRPSACKKCRAIPSIRTSRFTSARAYYLPSAFAGRRRNPMVNAQSAIRYDLDRDVKTVEAMAARLKPYIYEEELYGQMPGDPPKLTMAGLLMRLHRLSPLSRELELKN